MTQKTEHPYAHILRAIADGQTVQLRELGNWYDTPASHVLQLIAMGTYEQQGIRIKPRTININGHEVSEPLRKKPIRGEKYWVVQLQKIDPVMRAEWADDMADDAWFERGFCHATKEAAEAHARALLSFTKLPE